MRSAVEYPGRVERAAPHRPARARRARTSDGFRHAVRGPMPTSSARWTRICSHDPQYLPAMIEAAAAADLVIGSRYLQRHQRRQLAAPPHHPEPLRQPLHPHRHRPRRPRLHDRLPLLAARRAGEAAARSDRLRGLRVRRRDDVPGGGAGLADQRVADHLRRAPRRARRSCRRGVLLESLITPWRLVRRHGAPAFAGGRGGGIQFRRRAAMTSHPTPSLSVFFPAYNDSGTIASIVISAVQTAATLTPDYEVHRRQRRQPGRHGADPGRAGADVSRARARRPPREEPRLRRRAASGFAARHQGPGLLHRRRRAVRPAEMAAALGAHDRRTSTWSTATRSAGRIRCTASSSAASTTTPSRLLFGLTVRDVDCDFRLMRRSHLRRGAAREEQRRHLPGDDEEDPGRRLPHRRGAGAPLPPRLRQVAVLQLPAHLSGPAST